MSNFSVLAFQARVSPDNVDRNQLLIEASDILDRIAGLDTPGAPLAREMAVQAMELAVYGPICYMEFRAAFDAFMEHART